MVIGVTGGIGSGKSLFSRKLSKLGVYIINADKIARELIDKNKMLQMKIVDKFGSEVFDKEGNLQRRKLGQLVFANSQLLKQLNVIIHKSLLNEINKRIDSILSKNSQSVIAVDMAIIFEIGSESMFDYIVTIDAPLNLRIKWLQKNRGWTKKEIMDRINSQMDVEKKIEKSDFIIKNYGSIKDMTSKASKFLRLINSLSSRMNQ